MSQRIHRCDTGKLELYFYTIYFF